MPASQIKGRALREGPGWRTTLGVLLGGNLRIASKLLTAAERGADMEVGQVSGGREEIPG
jgi:hypothetical protein